MKLFEPHHDPSSWVVLESVTKTGDFQGAHPDHSRDMFEHDRDKLAWPLDGAQSRSHLQRVEATDHERFWLLCMCHRHFLVPVLIMSDCSQDSFVVAEL